MRLDKDFSYAGNIEIGSDHLFNQTLATVSTPSTRRLCAIMFTDIRGYTALMQQSEQAAVEIRSRHRQIFDPTTREFGGEIIQYYGDGTLSIFESTVDAVRCARALQIQFRQEPAIPVRIGIHTGDVLITDDDIIGDSVNLASRVESLGVPGSVLITAKVAEEIENQDDLSVKYVGDFHFKNDRTVRKIYALVDHQLVIPQPREMEGKLELPKPSLATRLKPSRGQWATGSVFVVLLLLLGWYIHHRSQVRWVENEAIPKIQQLVDNNWRDYTEAFALAEQAAKIIPNDSQLNKLLNLSSKKIAIRSEPPGATVYYKPYEDPESSWHFLGVTPIEGVRLPVGFLRWKLEKKGYETVLAAEPTFDIPETPVEEGYVTKQTMIGPRDFFRVMERTDAIPAGMTRVEGSQMASGDIPYFYIDKYEVTNRQYLDFVNQGGYRNRNYWPDTLVNNGIVLPWEQAMAMLVDQTGRPGPATWTAGSYPEGKADYPVDGVSWYEAQAYTRWAGKRLPSIDHWGLARGENSVIIRVPPFGGFAYFAPFSNFTGNGPVPVGYLPGYTSCGAYDMAGNVREWCENEMPLGRLVRGGAWLENTYEFGNLSQLPPFDRSEKNGFRCVVYPEPEKIPIASFAPVSQSTLARFGRHLDFNINPEDIVDDNVFAAYKAHFAYDAKPLNPILESVDSGEFWREESVSFDAPYGEERILAHLFLPLNIKPPYQTVIYFPGSAAPMQQSSDHLAEYYEFPVFLSFLLKSGRAVIFPVYKGTFERSAPQYSMMHIGNDSHLFSEYLSYLVKDFKRSIDYLESRPDIDENKLAYYGMSWGGAFGVIFTAVEDRLRASILLSGGLYGLKVQPDADQKQYAAHIKIPTLMINGKYDAGFTVDQTVKPLFDLLGTDAGDKKLFLSESDHIPKSQDFIRESLAWLDRYLSLVTSADPDKIANKR